MTPSSKLVICFFLYTIINMNVLGVRRCEIDDTGLHLNCSYRSIQRTIVLLDQEEKKNLVTVDFSSNNITEIEDLGMWYPNVQSMNFISNSISHIKNDTFTNLTKLEEIILSFNSLEYIDIFIFANNKRLKNVKLSGNLLKIPQDKPLLCSSSIQQLDISHCALLTVSKENFECLPFASEINLSNNGLTSLTPDTFSSLPCLTSIALSNNRFYCDCKFVALIRWGLSMKSDLSTNNHMCVMRNKGRTTLEKEMYWLNCSAQDSTETVTYKPESLRLQNDTIEEGGFIFITYELAILTPDEENTQSRYPSLVSNNLYLVQTILPIGLLLLVLAVLLLFHRVSAKRQNDSISVSSYDSEKRLFPVYVGDHTYMQVK